MRSNYYKSDSKIDKHLALSTYISCDWNSDERRL